MRTDAALFAGLVVGAILGVTGTLLFSDRDAPPATAPLEADPPAPAAAPAPVLESRALALRSPQAPAAPVAGDLHVAKAAFLQTYRSLYQGRTGALPSAAMEEAAWQQVQASATGSAQALALQAATAELASRRRAEITARDDIMALLDDNKRRDHVVALRNDPEAFARLLTHKSEPAQLDGGSHVLRAQEEPLEDGTVLYFRDGVHVLGEQHVLGRGRSARMPRDLTLEGAGIDRTLVVLSDFSARDLVYNLHLKDCTIDCGNDGAFDLRRERATVYAENVRFVRFDAGHGGCFVFDFSRGGAVYCKDCRFEGGYGRAPGSGNVARGLQVARFEDCLFDRIEYDVTGRGAVTFSGCTFRDCARTQASLERALASPRSDGARFEDCRTETTLPEGVGRKARARDLKTLFPAFTGK